MKFEGSRVYFSDGTEIYAHAGLISVDESGGIYGGYDFMIHSPDPYQDNLKKEHVIELADHMIAQWESVKRKAQEGNEA
jgi:hypothetical protein